MIIKDLPTKERPYEKLKVFGREVLSDAELLAIIVKSGTKEKTALEVIYELMNKYNYDEKGICFLNELSAKEIQSIKGLGDVKSIQLLALVEIARRIVKPSDQLHYKIDSPEDAASLLMEDMRHLKQEHFVSILLDTKNSLIRVVTNFIGGLNFNVVEPREVLKEAIKYSASSIIIAHNHPSGNPYPSETDIKLTNRLNEASNIVGIELKDHIIIGDGVFASLKKMKKF